jgi:hypothetical protein
MAEKSRRKLLKGLGISVPAAWAAPVIEAVILPAHATTTESCTTLFNLADHFPGQSTGSTGQSCPEGQSIVFDNLVINNCLDCTAEIVFTVAGSADDALEVDETMVTGTGYVCGSAVSNYAVGFVVKSNIDPSESTTINVLDVAPGGTGASGTIVLRCLR